MRRAAQPRARTDPRTERPALDEREKLEQRQRYERARRKHYRPREEQKAIEEAARARKSVRPDKRPRRRLAAFESSESDEGAAPFEKIRRAQRVRIGGPSPGPAPADREPATDAAPEAGTEVLVVEVHRDRVRVRDGEGRSRDVPLAGGAARRGARALAVGDRARLRTPSGGGPVTLEPEPRRSVLSRPDPADPRRERVLAANIDQALIVSAARRPAFRPGLVERMLLALARGGVAPRVCINKVDLLEGEAERAALLEACAPWRASGVPCHLLSVESGEGLDGLRAAIAGATCVLVGHSGVGKSSLVNALFVDRGRATGGVRSGDGKGRHTTSASALVELPDGTRLVDTPGVRAFGLWEVTRAQLSAAFPEVAALAAGCRFNDCSHAHEPDCAVQAAARAGELDGARLRSYLGLRAEVGG